MILYSQVTLQSLDKFNKYFLTLLCAQLCVGKCWRHESEAVPSSETNQVKEDTTSHATSQSAHQRETA